MNQKDGLVPAETESALPKIDPHTQLSPQKYLEYSKFYLRRQLKNAAREYALEAFRRGDVDVKSQAVRVLDDLNEVEYF
jgi:glucuronate isomerase